MHSKEISKLIKIAAEQGYTADDLRMEADCVDEYTEWQHMPLMGYFGDDLREAANRLELASMLPVYGIVDVKCGRELRYIYSEDEAIKYFGKDVVSLNADPWEYCIGNAYLCRLAGPEDVIGFLTAAPEVDLDDPMPVDLAEYYLAYDGSEGITKTVAELAGRTDVLSLSECDPRLDELIAAGYPENELYNEIIRKSDIRFSEIMDILEKGSFSDVVKAVEQ